MNRIDWDDLQLFLAAIEDGSYSAAAQRLALNRTTIGRRVQALERTMGQPLFELGPEGQRPTAAGRKVLAAARSMEQAMQKLRAQLHDEQQHLRGSLRLAAPIGLGPEFMPEYAAFSQAHPQVQLELINAQDSLASISQRKADLGLCIAHQVPEHLHGRRVTGMDRALYASRTYLERFPAGLDLGEHHWIGWGREMRHSQVALWMSHHLPAQIHVAAAVNSWSALREAVLAGLGVAPMWCFLADRDPRLMRIRPAIPELVANLWLLVHRDVPVNDRVRVFMEFIQPQLQRRIGGGAQAGPDAGG